MTMKYLMYVKQLLNTVSSTTCSLTSVELEDLRQAVEDALNLQRVEDFVEMLNNALPTSNASREAVELFNSTSWRLLFGDYAVDIKNCAVIYEGIVDTLTAFIDEQSK